MATGSKHMQGVHEIGELQSKALSGAWAVILRKQLHKNKACVSCAAVNVIAPFKGL